MDYTTHVNFLQQKGQELFGPHFLIHETDHNLLRKLIAYFLRNQEQTGQFNLNLSKGILLTGPIGTGKTTIMTLMRLLLPPSYRFAVKSCRELTFDFIKDGYQIIQKYSTQAFASTYPIIHDPKKPIPCCFDDHGTESSIKYFGNKCNVMGEILLSRYDCFIANKMITHATTNLSASELEAIYGNRVHSRLREMFNLIAFDKDTPDKCT